MHHEIDSLRQLLLVSQPRETLRPCLVSLVRLLAKSSLSDMAVSHFKDLRSRFPDEPPSVYLYNLLLESSLREKHVDFVLWLYKDMIVSGMKPETYTFNLLICSLCESDRLDDAREVFDKMREKGCQPNEYSVGILVRGYCRAGLSGRGLEVLDQMRSCNLLPNRVVYNTLISSFCKQGKTDDAEKLVERMREDGMFPDAVTFNSRISALCSAGKILEASRIFRDMHIDQEMGLPQPNVVTYNLMLQGFCREDMLEEAETLFKSMEKAGNFINLESYNIWLLGLVKNGKLLEARLVLKEMVDKGIEPNIYSYNIVINGLCKNGMLRDARMVMTLMAGRLDEAKKKFMEMMGKNLHPDSDMEKKGCNKSIQTYNSLILGLGSKKQIFEIYGLMDEMRERGVAPDVCTYNYMMNCLCEGERVKDATSLLDEMLQKGISPNISTFRILIKAFCKACDFGVAHEVFDIALSVCGHKEALYSFMYFYLGNFLYKDLIDRLCKDEKLEDASSILHTMKNKGYGFDPASFLPVIDGLGKRGNKHEADELAETMMEMESEGRVADKIYRIEREIIGGKPSNNDGSDWQTIVHRDDGSGIALKTLKRVQKGWGRGSLTSFQSQKNEFIDY
ncbi:pentatricopeptide repeat-containing protein [Prunus yedoensis var. nudiflora]|uniref:Pentatricopeptide repeat-containing protein n=1 Tax=Prunus yedoensis var. nudiflora TaxID=2094558 RepID=A0A314ZJ11_PRUYE|nr:pentatricopeptide repeat-containing protein [Prunus yedoensis var. nudiflora]